MDKFSLCFCSLGPGEWWLRLTGADGPKLWQTDVGDYGRVFLHKGIIFCLFLHWSRPIVWGLNVSGVVFNLCWGGKSYKKPFAAYDRFTATAHSAFHPCYVVCLVFVLYVFQTWVSSQCIFLILDYRVGRRMKLKLGRLAAVVAPIQDAVSGLSFPFH